MTRSGADTVLLIHITSEQGAAAEKRIAGIDPLLSAFTAKIASLKMPVFIGVASAPLRAELQKRLPDAKVVEPAGELPTVRQIFADKKTTHIALANGIYPLLDMAQTEKLFGVHTEYRADISYAENLPPGIALSFVSRDLLESIDIMEAKDADFSDSGIRAFVEKNINQFHAEVHYEEPDLRLLRLDFSLATNRSIAKAAAVLEKIQNKNEPYAELEGLFRDAPELLHTFPSWIEIEFSSAAEYKGYFSPLGFIRQEKHLLERENFERIQSYIATGFGDTSVCASGLGEPLEHPDAPEFLKALLENENIRYVFTETNGIHLDKLLPLAAHPQAGKLRIIVLLNSLERYAELSGAPQATLEKVKSNVRGFAAALKAAGKNAPEIIHVQVLKVEENETEIDALYALVEELGAGFLLQKYNRYAGLMPERRVSDMTPLERYSCWHLRRDLFVRANGDVAFCKQTVDQSKNSARGNLAKDDLSKIWNSQRADFAANFQEKYPPHLPCADCDEYFTFNF